LQLVARGKRATVEPCTAVDVPCRQDINDDKDDNGDGDDDDDGDDGDDNNMGGPAGTGWGWIDGLSPKTQNPLKIATSPQKQVC
jgi:hypothetical protein